MVPCTKCFYAKRTALATYDPNWTCLHPKAIDMHALRRPPLCTEARGDKGPCGPEAALFLPQSGTAQPLHLFRQ